MLDQVAPLIRAPNKRMLNKNRISHPDGGYDMATRILLVDDESSIIDVCRDILTNLGYTIFTAGSGQEAIAIYTLNKDKIDLVILDMIMPGLNGNETYNQLKSINPRVKVILSTGFSGGDQAQKILDNGCQGLIQKPFRIEDLSQKIREVLDQE